MLHPNKQIEEYFKNDQKEMIKAAEKYLGMKRGDPPGIEFEFGNVYKKEDSTNKIEAQKTDSDHIIEINGLRHLTEEDVFVYKSYLENDLFKQYVDKYCQHRGISLNEALTHKICLEYLAYITCPDSHENLFI